MYPNALYCAYLHSWCDQQRAATSAETTVRLLQIGWNADVREAARKVKCPVLILHPERDAVVPLDQGRLLASLMPNSRFVQIDTETPGHRPPAFGNSREYGDLTNQ